MEKEPVRESNGKVDKQPLYMRLYFRAEYIEIARLVGYQGRPLAEARNAIQKLGDQFEKEKLVKAAEDLVEISAEFVKLKPEVRRLCHQLLGQDPATQANSNGTAPSGPSQTDVPKIDAKPVEPPKVKPTSTRKPANAEPKAESLPREEGRKDTPIMAQYREAKERHKDMVVLFRLGDFYETFEDDAETLHKTLGLTLTTRDREMKMCGFPHYQLETYLHKLLKEGKRVAIADQVDSDDGKRVKREVTRVVTPAIDEKPAEGKPVKQPRHFVMKKYEEMLNAEGLAFVSVADAKKTTPAIVPHVAGLDYIVLRGEEKLLITIRPNLPTKNANAAKEVQKLFGNDYRSVRIWPSETEGKWKWEKFPI